MTYTITPEKIYLFLQLLREEERSAGTIENYQRHIKAFAAWAGEADVTRELAAKWKAHLPVSYTHLVEQLSQRQLEERLPALEERGLRLENRITIADF